MSRRIIAGLVCLVAALNPMISTAVAGEPIGVATQTLQDWLVQGKAPVLLDVRSEQEFNAGHVAGALNFPIRDLAASLTSLMDKKSSPIVLYCETGPRANYAHQLMSQYGFDNLSFLIGHMRAWRQAGLPIEK